jgi:hypothetical protein
MKDQLTTALTVYGQGIDFLKDQQKQNSGRTTRKVTEKLQAELKACRAELEKAETTAKDEAAKSLKIKKELENPPKNGDPEKKKKEYKAQNAKKLQANRTLTQVREKCGELGLQVSLQDAAELKKKLDAVTKDRNQLDELSKIVNKMEADLKFDEAAGGLDNLGIR